MSTAGTTRKRVRIELAKIGWSCKGDEQKKETGEEVELHFIGKRITK